MKQPKLNIDTARLKKLALPVGAVFLALTLVLWVANFIVRSRVELVFLARPGSGATIRLDEQLTFAASTETVPTTCTFEIPSLPTNEYRVSRNKNVLSVTPTWHWPVKSRIEIRITCDGTLHEFAFITPDEGKLSLDEQVLIQAASDYEVGQAARKFEQEYPYANQFPLERETYVLLYVPEKDEIRIIMRGSTTVSPAEQERLVQTERFRLNELGVPQDVPIIFGSN